MLTSIQDELTLWAYLVLIFNYINQNRYNLQLYIYFNYPQNNNIVNIKWKFNSNIRYNWYVVFSVMMLNNNQRICSHLLIAPPHSLPLLTHSPPHSLLLFTHCPSPHIAPPHSLPLFTNFLFPLITSRHLLPVLTHFFSSLISSPHSLPLLTHFISSLMTPPHSFLILTHFLSSLIAPPHLFLLLTYCLSSFFTITPRWGDRSHVYWRSHCRLTQINTPLWTNTELSYLIIH